MSRRKKRKTKKGIWKATKAFSAAVMTFTVKVIPLVICITLAGGILLGVRNALYADSNLALQHIKVEPSHGLSSAVYKKLETQYLGSNILKIDIKNIAREIEKDPYIRTALISRRFPADLKIEIIKRTPVGLIQFTPKGRYGLISEDGMVLDVLKGRTESLLVFEAFSLGLTDPRTGVRVKSPGFHEAVEFMQAYWRHPISQKESINRIRLDRIGNMTAFLEEGPSLRMGRKPTERLAAMEKIIPLLKGSKRKRLDYIDLQYDDVIVKRKG